MDDGSGILKGLLFILIVVAAWYLWPIISSFFSTTHEGLLG